MKMSKHTAEPNGPMRAIAGNKENSESSFEWQIAIQREAARLASAVLAVR